MPEPEVKTFQDYARARGIVIETLGEVASAAEGIAGKPRPDTYLRGAELLGVPADRGVVVDVAVSGVQAGAAGGFAHVVGVDRGAGRQVLLDEGADVVVVDLAELIPGVKGGHS